MRVLFLTHAFNSLTQRLYTELSDAGHKVSIEFDIADSVAEEAVAQFQPELIVAPFLKRAIPVSIWSRHLCLVVHPGIVGDRGPSALDWAIQAGEECWGVTVLQAEAEMDAGPVWATAEFSMRCGRKASLYRNEVTEAACHAILRAVQRMAEFKAGRWAPLRLADAPSPARGRLRPPMKQADRAIDWRNDDSASVLRKINAGDGFPGVADLWFGVPCHVFDAWPEAHLSGTPGEVIARRETALLRATRNGAVWVGHAKRKEGFKLPATLAFAAEAASVPETPLDGWWAVEKDRATWQDIRYEEMNEVGCLHFEFYNGAMGTRQCQRLQAAFEWAQTRPTRVIVLAGGEDFWSNGIHLNLIENAASAADESWANINAIDDLAEAILRCGSQLTVAALAGNTGAGGCFLARAADQVWVRAGVMLNPHYKNMGNLYGSEFWTYLLPPRVGADGARKIMQHRLPMTARQAVECGFYDQCIAVEQGSPAGDGAGTYGILATGGGFFAAETARRAAILAAADDYPQQLAAKRARRAADEAAKPLAAYRAEELAQMRRNFYGFDPSYHYARHHFVHKVPHAWTPRHLARHRDHDATSARAA